MDAEAPGGAIAALDNLNANQLREEWRRLLGKEPPALRSRFLLRAELAWALQARAFGDLDPATRRRLAALARQERGGRKAAQASRLKSGMVLVREWQGVERRVEVLERGFRHDGRTYRSLSAVARHIAGARWSGPRFFGLLKRFSSSGRAQ